MVRGPKGSGADNPRSGLTRQIVELGYFERLLESRSGKDAHDSLGEEIFTGAGRPREQKVVAAGHGDFDRSFGRGLTINEVEIGGGLGCAGVGGGDLDEPGQ